MQARSSLTLVSGMLVAVLSCSAEEPAAPPTDPAQSDTLSGGAPSNCYPQVVSLRNSTGHLCTGVVIAPNLVLTAAHCVTLAALNNQMPMSDVVGANYAHATVSQYYVNPQYTACQPPGANFDVASAHDMAVVRIEGNVLPANVPPAVIGTTLPAVGSTLQIIGYGAPDFDRRQGQFRFDGTRPGGYLDTTSLSAGICPGDSGAPLFTRPESGACDGQPPPTVHAIVSDSPGDQPGSCSANTAAIGASLEDPTNAAFLQQAMAGNAQAFDYSTLQNCCGNSTVQSCVVGLCLGSQTCDPSTHTWGACECPSGDGGSGGGGGGPNAGCGNGVCDSGENPLSCPIDCGSCGDGFCDSNESSDTCPMDCFGSTCVCGWDCPPNTPGCGGFCGDGQCDLVTEDSTNCSADCGGSSCVCGWDCPPYTPGCSGYCGDGQCDLVTENSTNCSIDCGFGGGGGGGGGDPCGDWNDPFWYENFGDYDFDAFLYFCEY